MDIAEAEIVLGKTEYTYSGSACQPSVKVVYQDEHTLQSGYDYEFTYSNNVYIGKATVTVTGKGRFTGTAVKTFDILPKKVTSGLSTSVNSRRCITFSWSPVDGSVTGYEVEYADNSAFTGATSERVTEETSCDTSVLLRKKTYYFRVRAYKTVGNTDYYGDWSNTRSQNAGSQLIASRDFLGFKNPEASVGKEYYDVFYKKGDAKQLYKKYEDLKGWCYGMSIASISSVWYEAPPESSIDNKYLNWCRNYNKFISGSNLKISEFCKYAHVFQYRTDIQEHRAKNKKAQGLYDAVKAYLSGYGAPVTISLRNKETNQGHRLVVTNMREEGDFKYLDVYDPALPLSATALYFDIDLGEWSYRTELIDWSGDFFLGNELRYDTLSGQRFSEVAKYLLSGETDKIQKTTAGKKLFYIESSDGAAADAYVKNQFGDDVISLPSDNGTGTSKGQLYWLSGSSFTMKNLPAGTEIGLSCGDHLVNVTVEQQATLTLNVQDSKNNSVEISGAGAKDFSVTFYDGTTGSSKVETVKVTGASGSGKTVKIAQTDSDVKITGAVSMQVTSQKGTEDSNGKLQNATTKKAQAVGLDSAGTYQAAVSGSKLQVKGSSGNNGVYDQVVSTTGSVPTVGKVYTSGKLKYKVLSVSGISGTASVSAPKSKSQTSVTIPDTVKIGGVKLKVTAIEKKAFKGMEKLQKVTVGKNVTKIGASAFYGDKKLSAVTLKGKGLKSVGKSAFKGISAKAVFTVPKGCLTAAKKLLTAATGYTSGMKVQDTGGQKIWTVVFKNGSKTVKTQYVTDKKAAKAPKVTKKGYVLSWSVSFSKVQKNLTVKAVWTRELPNKGYTATVNGLKYKVTKSHKTKGTVQLTGVASKKKTGYTVPSKVKIGKTTFTVSSIGAKAFYKCSRAKQITLPKTITSIGKNAFQGTSANLTVRVPKAQYKELKKLLQAAGLNKKAAVKKK